MKSNFVCLTCGHSKADHIYEEGACRPGYLCPCQKFVSPRKKGIKMKMGLVKSDGVIFVRVADLIKMLSHEEFDISVAYLRMSSLKSNKQLMKMDNKNENPLAKHEQHKSRTH